MKNNEMLMEVLKMMMNSSGDSSTEKSDPVNKGRYIVLGNRGNIVVGDLVISGSTGYMTNASVIRRWGTTKGLGELAIDGPTNDTILDRCGEFEFEILTTCGMIPVKSKL